MKKASEADPQSDGGASARPPLVPCGLLPWTKATPPRAAQAGAARAARATRKARAGALAEGGARVGSGGLSDSSFVHALCEQHACEQRACERRA